MRNKYIILILIASALIAITLILLGVYNKPDIVIENDDSYFSDFSVEDDKVYIECVLSVKSTFKKVQTVNFIASFDEDVELGLLKQSELYAYQEDRNTIDFTIQKGKQSIKVIFIGDYAGNHQRHDRELPDNIRIRRNYNAD